MRCILLLVGALVLARSNAKTLFKSQFDALFQPTVTVVHTNVAFSGFLGSSKAGLYPWCDGAPMFWWEVHGNRAPYCLKHPNGNAENPADWSLGLQWQLPGGKDRHTCVALDLNDDEVLDLACVVGARKGTSFGANQVYFTDQNGSLVDQGTNGLQKYPSMRTREMIVLQEAASGAHLLMITTTSDGGPRQDGQPNHHRMFRHVNGTKFDEVNGPWIAETSATCLRKGDLNNDGHDDFVVCNRKQNAWLFIQGHSGDANDWAKIDLSSIGDAGRDWNNVRIADVTGDGLPDLLVVGPVRLAAGDAFLRIYQGNDMLPVLFDFDEPYYEFKFDYEPKDLEVFDVNDDGLLDVYVVVEDRSVEGSYCNTNNSNATVPVDKAHDFLFVSFSVQEGSYRRFVPVELLHEQKGCGGHVAFWQERMLAVANGRFIKRGDNMLMKWLKGLPQKPPFPGPNHHWSFDGNALDSIGNADGWPVATGTVRYSDNKIEGMQSLDLANGDFVEMTSYDLKQEISGYYAISLWFKATSLGGVVYLYEEGGRNSGIALRINDNKIEAVCNSFYQGGVKVARALGTVQVNQWHHAFALYDGYSRVIQIFVDGRNKATADTGFSLIPFHFNPASIGGPGPYGTTAKFEGLVDSVSLWADVPFSDEDVQALYESQAVPRVRFPAFYWTFDGELGDYAEGFRGATFSDDSVQGNMSLYLPHGGAAVFKHPDLRRAFSKFSVSLFFKQDNVTDIDSIRYLFETGAGQNGLAIRLSGNVVEVACIRDRGREFSVGVQSTFDSTMWHHVVGVFDSENGKLRIVLDGSNAEEIHVGYEEVHHHANATTVGGVGLRGSPDDGQFVGHVDEVKVWINSALTMEEIGMLYDELIGR